MKPCPFCAEDVQDAAKVCKHCRHQFVAAAKTPSERLSTAGKHPIAVLLAATLLGSIIVPMVSASIEEDKRRRELKTQRATEILRLARSVDRDLNLVLTEFYNFHRDQIMTGLATEQSRSTLRERIYERYEVFNATAWWWHWQAAEEAELLALVDANARAELMQAVVAYHENVLQSTQALDVVWAALLRPAAEPAENVARTIDQLQQRQRDLEQSRSDAVRRMVAVVRR